MVERQQGEYLMLKSLLDLRVRDTKTVLCLAPESLGHRKYSDFAQKQPAGKPCVSVIVGISNTNQYQRGAAAPLGVYERA
jgi:hypothetical protein